MQEALRKESTTFPWDDHPYRLVSLLAMIEFFGCVFWNNASHLGMITNRLRDVKDGDEPFDIPKLDADIRDQISHLHREFTSHNLYSSSAQCIRILKMLDSDEKTATFYKYLGESLRELVRRVEDELHAHCFLHLSLAEAELYKHPFGSWEKIVDCFGDITRDGRKLLEKI